jgi:hypothetical protein
VYLAVSLLLMFGWVYQLQFAYTRAVYFLNLPIALGGTLVVIYQPSGWYRPFIFAVLITCLTFYAVERGRIAASNYAVLDHDVLEAADWLRANSDPNDVIVTGNFLGFQLPRLIERPILASFDLRFIGNPQEIPAARAANAVMYGLPTLPQTVEEYQVRFVISRPDTAPVGESPPVGYVNTALGAYPYAEIAFQNNAIIIYELAPDVPSS